MMGWTPPVAASVSTASLQVLLHQSPPEESAMDCNPVVATVAIDLAKSVFQLGAARGDGSVRLGASLRRIVRCRTLMLAI